MTSPTMKRITLKLAASSLPLGLLVTAGAAAPAAAFQSQAPADPQAASLFEQAGRAISDNRLPDAVSLLERAVGLAPRDAGYRMLLADSYLKIGRFGSAETTYGDVLLIDPNRPRAGLSRALMQVATGRPQEAIAQLDAVADRNAAADIGLAYALAGAPQRAVELLEAAARAPGATPRIRQNLALAYAFGGDWERARTIAAQDLAPSEVNERITHWATLAHRAGSPEPVAALLGVAPTADPGQPVQIALNRPVDAPTSAPIRMADAAVPVQVAMAEPAADTDNVPMPTDSNSTADAAQPVAVAEVADPAPVAVPVPEPVAAPAVAFAEAAPAPVVVPSETQSYAELEAAEWGVEDGQVALPAAAPREERQPARERYAAAAETLIRPDPVMMPVASRAARSMAPVASKAFRTAPLPGTRSDDGRFVVQLGAFGSAAGAEHAWTHYEEHFGLRAETPVTMTFDHRGRILHRVAISGFDRRADASQICRIITARGGQCFVRATESDAIAAWVRGAQQQPA